MIWLSRNLDDEEWTLIFDTDFIGFLALNLAYPTSFRLRIIEIAGDPNQNAKLTSFSEASYSNNEVAELIRTFPERLPGNKSLRAMGYKEVDSPDGFRYEQIPWTEM